MTGENTTLDQNVSVPVSHAESVGTHVSPLHFRILFLFATIRPGVNLNFNIKTKMTQNIDQQRDFKMAFPKPSFGLPVQIT